MRIHIFVFRFVPLTTERTGLAVAFDLVAFSINGLTEVLDCLTNGPAFAKRISWSYRTSGFPAAESAWPRYAQACGQGAPHSGQVAPACRDRVIRRTLGRE
jgi:hypothetical protein